MTQTPPPAQQPPVPQQPPAPQPGATPDRSEANSKKILCGILGIVLGGWGIHKFVLGYSKAGIIQIILTVVTCGIGGLIGLIEGIIYLTKSDEEFYNTYMVGTKEWF
ncbi:MAG: NINE protein [Planctomycetes bacterium]|jgi:TM2 domain-containing membrane protein YozV|nr:TM2 domain-containing protein [Phycisphaerae bacterium]NBB95417.1 NINE protein [Planctomycetota bacterium]